MSGATMNRRRALLALVSGGAAASSVRTAAAAVHAQGSPTSVELRGSTAMLPLAQRVAEAFMNEHPDATITVSGGGAARGLKSIIVGTSELAMATSVLPDSLETLARSHRVALERFDVFRDAVVAVVHPRNPIVDLPVWTLRDVFRGAVKNWKEVGGADGPIVVMSFPGRSGTYETFKQAVLGDAAVVTPAAISTDAAHIVKRVASDPSAIGYLSMHDAAAQKDALKALRINGFAASAETVRNESYRVLRICSLWARQPISPATRVIIDEFLSPTKGQSIVAELGDVALR